MMMTPFMPPHAHTTNNNGKVIIWFVSALTLSVLITNVHPATIKKREIPLNPQQKVGEIPIVHIVNNTIISKLTKTDPDIGEENEGKYQIVNVDDTAETTHRSNVSESNEDNKQLNLSRITVEKFNHEAALNIETTTTTTTTTSASSNFSIAELSVNDINAKYEKEEKVKHNNNNHAVNRPTGATEEINDSKTALKIFDHDLLQLLGAEDKKEDLEVTENALKIINETYKNSITSSLTEQVSTSKAEAQATYFDSSTERPEQDEELITTQQRSINHSQPPIDKEEFYRKGKKAWLESSSIAEAASTEISVRKYTISTESPFLEAEKIEISTVTLPKDTFTTNRQEQEHGQSLSTTTTTNTFNSHNVNENEILTTTTAKMTLNPFTTLKSFIKSTTDSDVEKNIEIKMPSASSSSSSILNSEEINEVRVSSAEKKAKFINNNSTNAQQLNLPNASAVWSLVGMKTVTKSNDTIATSKQSSKANSERNFNETLTNNGNSEKTLLDWTQIMANKDLVTNRVNQSPNTAVNDIDSTEDIIEDSTVGAINTAEKKHLSNNDIFLDETTTTTTIIASNISKELMISPNITEQQIVSIPTPANAQSPLEDLTTTILSAIENESTQETPAIVTMQTITEAADTAQTITSTAQPMSDETTTFKNAINMPTTLPNYLDMQSPPTFNESLTLTANRSETTTQNTDEHYLKKTNNVNAVTDYHANASANVDDAVTTAVNVDVGQASSETTTFSTLIDDELNASISHTLSVYTTTVIPRHSFVNSIEEETTIITIEDDQSYTTPTFSPTNESILINVEQNKDEGKENSTTTTTTTTTTSTKTIESTPKAYVALPSPTVLTITANIANITTTTTSTLPLSVMSEETSETKTSVTEITPVASGTSKPSSESSIETNAIEVLDKNNTNVKDKTKQINIAEIKTNETKSEKRLEYETEQPEKDNHNNKLFITRKTATTTITTPAIRTINTTMSTNTTTEETLISLLDDYSTTTSAAIATTTTTTATATTTATMMTPTTATATTATTVNIGTKVEDIYKVIHSTTAETPQTTTILQIPAARTPIIATTPSTQITTTTSIYPPKVVVPTLATTIMGNANAGGGGGGGGGGHLYTKTSESPAETDVNVIIAITVSVIGVIALILLVAFLYLMRKRQKSSSYSQRCRPVSLDDYTIDNTSVYNSMRLKGAALRSSKRSHANLAFDDPSLRHNALSTVELARFVQEKSNIYEEFRDVPQVTARPDEVPLGCEDKNRYANVVPLPETRIMLQRLNDDVRTEYINANYVRGPKDSPKYYIACQAPLDSTVEDFWRMIWEQQSRVIIQATDLIESGVEKCAEYLPPSVTLDNHSTFGDFQVTLQNREIKDKYAISTIQLKRTGENVTRELTHYWYKWPETGVPAEEAPIIAMLLEARSSLISYAIEHANEMKEKSSTLTLRSTEEISSANSTTSAGKDSNGSTGNTREINGNISMVHIKKTARNQGPLTVHCSPGTGRTGTIIACDIAIRSLEMPKRAVDIPQIVYYVRHGRASAVRTKEQYEFIYKVANMYATKITNPSNDN
uniref:protein-tyrosine-phosphatase n=1 Tax=Glossina austeni TaxID=7395 RepID=A0A1A9VPL5_GLOAU